MLIRLCRSIGAPVFFAIITAMSSAPAQSVVGYEEISAWIAAHHQNIIAGDPHVNALLFVVDTNSAYVASVADSLPLAVMAAFDSGFAAVGARNAIQGMANDLVAGRLWVPGADSVRTIYIVDGVRVKRVDSLAVQDIEDIQVLSGAAAASKYGSDAAKGGAIVVKLTHAEGQMRVIDASNRERLTKLGINPERVDRGDMQTMQVKAGVYGPRSLYIVVMRLKKTPVSGA